MQTKRFFSKLTANPRLTMVSLLATLALNAQAVGLGELVIHSKLGERLDAEIPVMQTAGSFNPSEDMFISIASEVEHNKRNISGYLARQRIQLKLTETIDEDVVIKLSSSEPINEPFLNFLLELKWKTGRLIKEYTLLMDPPGYTASTQAGTVSLSATSQQSADGPSYQQIQLPVVKKKLTNTPYENGLYGPVQAGETLSEIAMRVRPRDHAIPLNKMIDIIFDQNPHAFINGQQDLLLQGVVLTIPELTNIKAILNNEQQPETPVKNSFVKSDTVIKLESEINIRNTGVQHVPLTTLAGLKLTTKLDNNFLNAIKTDSTVYHDASTSHINTADTPVTIAYEAASNIMADKNQVEAIEAEFDIEDSESISTEEILSETEEVEADDFITTVTPTVSDEIETVTTVNEPLEKEVSSTTNSMYLYISIFGAVLCITMLALWFYYRREMANRYVPFPTVQKPKQSIPPRVLVKPEQMPEIEPSLETEEVLATTTQEIDLVDIEQETDEFDMEKTIKHDDEHIATVVMSPEEFKAAGIDIETAGNNNLLSENEIDNLDSEEDESLISDYLDTVEVPMELLDMETNVNNTGNDDTDMLIASDDLEQVVSGSDGVINLSVPMDHEDNEVNSIINDLLEGTPDINLDESQASVESNRDHNTVINLDQGIDYEQVATTEEAEHDIEDLIVNFQDDSPEKEFEKQVSIFMAYGDYLGAEEVIDKALKDDPENTTYRIAQLSLLKATAKFGAALELAKELIPVKDSMTDLERKKLEILSDDLLNDDDNTIYIAS